MTDILNNSAKSPKPNYKKQLRNEMMKSFTRFFSNSQDCLETSDSTINLLGKEPNYDLKKRILELSESTASCQEKDGFDFEFEVFLMQTKESP